MIKYIILVLIIMHFNIGFITKLLTSLSIYWRFLNLIAALFDSNVIGKVTLVIVEL